MTVLIIAKNEISVFLRSRMVYGALLVMVLSVAILTMISYRSALVLGGSDAKDAAMLTSLVAGTSLLILELAFIFGISTVWRDRVSGTLVQILSRPITRTTFILGKCCGVTIVVGLAQIACIAIIGGWAGLHRVALDIHVWMQLLDALVTAIMIGTIGIALGLYLHPLTAGGTIIGLGIAAEVWPDAAVVARVLKYLLPASMPQDVIGLDIPNAVPVSVSIEWALYAAVLGENLLYAMVVLGVAVAIFQRRDIRPGDA